AIAKRKTQELVDALHAAGVPALEPKRYDTTEFMTDPDNLRTGRVMEYVHRTHGRRREIGRLIRVDGSGNGPEAGAPDLGEHTADVLAEVGVDTAQLDELVTAGVARTDDTGEDQATGE